MNRCIPSLSITLFTGLVCGVFLPPDADASSRPSDEPHYEEMLEMHRAYTELQETGRYEEAYAALLAKEERARELDDPYWIWGSLWRQAQYHSRLGDTARTIELYNETAYYLRLAEERMDWIHWVNRWHLHTNRVAAYRASGQVGEAYRIQRLATDDAITYFRERHGTDISADPVGMILESGGALTFIGAFLADEATFGFMKGKTEYALAITSELIARQEAGAGGSHWNDFALAYAYSTQIGRLHHVGRHSEAMELSQRLLAMEESSSTSHEINLERVRFAFYRIRQAADPEPLVSQAEEAMRVMREKRHLVARLMASEFLARIYFHLGNRDGALHLLDEVIEETRGYSRDTTLAKLLLVRAELLLEIGEGARAEADLLEALARFRQQGQWRLEVGGYSLYARHLLSEGKLDRARQIAARGVFLATEFDEPRWLEHLSTTRAALLERMAAEREEEQRLLPGLADLQPVQMFTRVAVDELARGRFVLNNIGPEPVEGEITVAGKVGQSAWNAERRILSVEIEDRTMTRTVAYPVSVAAGENVTLYLQTAPDVGNVNGSVTVGWSGATDQLAFWEYETGGEEDGVAVVTASVAIENPFYDVPLYHEIYYRDEEPRDQSIRVRSSYPARVEIVDDLSGRLLAVDATGNGDFTGPGDMVFHDNNRDGFPDLSLSAEADFAALLLFVFPEPGHTGVEDLEVAVDLLDNGEWRPAGLNRFIPE